MSDKSDLKEQRNSLVFRANRSIFDQKKIKSLFHRKQIVLVFEKVKRTIRLFCSSRERITPFFKEWQEQKSERVNSQPLGISIEICCVHSFEEIKTITGVAHLKHINLLYGGAVIGLCYVIQQKFCTKRTMCPIVKNKASKIMRRIFKQILIFDKQHTKSSPVKGK